MSLKDETPETFADQLSRLHLIASGDRDCDMSDNDLGALRALLMTFDQMVANGCEVPHDSQPPQPVGEPAPPAPLDRCANAECQHLRGNHTNNRGVTACTFYGCECNQFIAAPPAEPQPETVQDGDYHSSMTGSTGGETQCRMRLSGMGGRCWLHIIGGPFSACQCGYIKGSRPLVSAPAVAQTPEEHDEKDLR